MPCGKTSRHSPSLSGRFLPVLATQGDTISTALIGCDVAGSLVTMDVKRVGTSDIEHVTLTRMTNEAIADRRALFEIFSTVKNRANQRDDKGDPQKSSI